MAKVRDILIIILVLLIFGVASFLMLQPKEKQTMSVPVKIELILPEVTGVSDTVYLDSIVYKDRVVYKEHKPDKELLAAYLNAKDSISKLNLHLDAITERNYSISYTDSVQTVNVHSRLRGHLLSQSIDYTIPERTATVDTTLNIPVEKHIEFYGLAKIGIPFYPLQQRVNVNGDDVWIPSNSGLAGSATLIMKNKRDDLFSISIDTELRGYIGYGVKF